MPTITCPQCGQNYDDEELFCPHCGAAQIPQATKAALHRQHADNRRTPRGAKIGCLVGIGVGVVLFAVVRFWLAPREDAADLGLLVVPVVFGAVGGLLVQRWLRSRGSPTRR